MSTLDTNIIRNTKKIIKDFDYGFIEIGSLGYKFKTSEFLDLIFLYKNSVDAKTPDILSINNRNTFFYELNSQIKKIKEQIQLDPRDLNMLIPGDGLARFVLKASNLKFLSSNDFGEVLDRVSDNGVDYGSGFLKLWLNGEDVLCARSVDPFHLKFNSYNFKKGGKVETFTKTVQDILEDDKYNNEARLAYKLKYPNYLTEDADKEIQLSQLVEDVGEGQRVSVVDVKNEIVLSTFEKKKGKVVWYYKFDFDKRSGFEDALGVGANELVFNKIVQSKVNRERLDKVMEIATKLVFQKQIDNENDDLVGKDHFSFDDGEVLGYTTNPLQPLNVGGAAQIQMLTQELTNISNTIGSDLSVFDALSGKTLPSRTSAQLGNLLTENASSTFKKIQQSYGRVIGRAYKEVVIPYFIDNFDTNSNLKNILTGYDIKIVEGKIKNYLLARAYALSVIKDEEWNKEEATKEAENLIKRNSVVVGDYIKTIKKSLDNIQVFITDEEVNKPAVAALMQDLRAVYAANPPLLKDPFYTSVIKKQAEYDAGLSEYEIDLLLEQIPDQNPEAVVS